MDTLAAETPAVLGYLTLALLLAAGVIATLIGRRAIRNRKIRHARLGCPICRAELDGGTR